MLPDITVVITNPIRGNMQNVVMFEKVLAQIWPDRMSEMLMNAPKKMAAKHSRINFREIPIRKKSMSFAIIINSYNNNNF